MGEEINYTLDEIKVMVSSIYGETANMDYYVKNFYDLNEERLSLKKSLKRDKKIDLILDGMD
jgi:hypothetical protein